MSSLTLDQVTKIVDLLARELTAYDIPTVEIHSIVLKIGPRMREALIGGEHAQIRELTERIDTLEAAFRDAFERMQ